MTIKTLNNVSLLIGALGLTTSSYSATATSARLLRLSTVASLAQGATKGAIPTQPLKPVRPAGTLDLLSQPTYLRFSPFLDKQQNKSNAPLPNNLEIRMAKGCFNISNRDDKKYEAIKKAVDIQSYTHFVPKNKPKQTKKQSSQPLEHNSAQDQLPPELPLYRFPFSESTRELTIPREIAESLSQKTALPQSNQETPVAIPAITYQARPSSVIIASQPASPQPLSQETSLSQNTTPSVVVTLTTLSLKQLQILQTTLIEQLKAYYQLYKDSALKGTHYNATVSEDADEDNYYSVERSQDTAYTPALTFENEDARTAFFEKLKEPIDEICAALEQIKIIITQKAALHSTETATPAIEQDTVSAIEYHPTKPQPATAPSEEITQHAVDISSQLPASSASVPTVPQSVPTEVLAPAESVTTHQPLTKTPMQMIKPKPPVVTSPPAPIKQLQNVPSVQVPQRQIPQEITVVTSQPAPKAPLISIPTEITTPQPQPEQLPESSVKDLAHVPHERYFTTPQEFEASPKKLTKSHRASVKRPAAGKAPTIDNLSPQLPLAQISTAESTVDTASQEKPQVPDPSDALERIKEERGGPGTPPPLPDPKPTPIESGMPLAIKSLPKGPLYPPMLPRGGSSGTNNTQNGPAHDGHKPAQQPGTQDKRQTPQASATQPIPVLHAPEDNEQTNTSSPVQFSTLPENLKDKQKPVINNPAQIPTGESQQPEVPLSTAPAATGAPTQMYTREPLKEEGRIEVGGLPNGTTSQPIPQAKYKDKAPRRIALDLTPYTPKEPAVHTQPSVLEAPGNPLEDSQPVLPETKEQTTAATTPVATWATAALGLFKRIRDWARRAFQYIASKIFRK